MDVKCPIRSVDLPGVPDVKLQGLIVIVGPNSSGKTQLLHDLNEVVVGRPRELVVASGVSFNPPPPFNEYFAFLVGSGSIWESSPNQFLKRSLQYGADEGGGSFHKSNVESHYQQHLQIINNKVSRSLLASSFLTELGPLTCSALFLKNRLTLMDSCPNFDHRTQGPAKTLQSLYRNKTAKAALYSEIAHVFQRAAWVDNSRHGQLVIRVADSPTLPPPDDRLEPEIMEGYRTIETEGDGLRSYSAVCATLLLEERPLCLIDEPEMCLHPPQAHAMGRFIGTHASEESCTVVATHSSHVLRGILETKPKAHVIRLTRVRSTFQARNLTPELLDQATSKPRSRSEAILEGLLSHGVVLCEAEGDRIVYESTYRTLKDRRLDIRFIPSEGTGGFADPLRLYKALNIPTAVVADLDFLAKDGELRKVLTELGTPDGEVGNLCALARQAIGRIKSCIAQIDPTEVQATLADFAKRPIDLTKKEDAKLRGRLQDIVNKLYRLHDLKERGIEAIPGEYEEGKIKIALKQDVQTLLSTLEKHGLFLVPVGELESWLPILMKGQSREDKSKWAMLAAEKIEDVRERDDDVWQFLRSVYRFLQQRLETTIETQAISEPQALVAAQASTP
jgi:hypothetical protein